MRNKKYQSIIWGGVERDKLSDKWAFYKINVMILFGD